MNIFSFKCPYQTTAESVILKSIYLVIFKKNPFKANKTAFTGRVMPAPINYSSIYEFIHKWHILSIDIVLITRNYTHEKIHIISALANNLVRNNRHPITIKFERQRTL